MMDVIKEIILNERREIAVEMLREGIPTSKISKILKMSEQEVEELRKQIH